MAFYLVIDGQRNACGEADSFVVRASGRRQAISLAPLADPKNADVEKLEDGRGIPNGVILSSLVDETETESATDDADGDDPYASYSF
ncbi:hypothetical protein [Streptomyces tsukubensis]|uniref:hypothetical protein n=1 Tax=Streptomyces tsukubensis TaxID=83656 RepID=UPI00344B37DD